MVRLLVVLVAGGLIAHGVAGAQGRRRTQRAAEAELAAAASALGVVALEMRSGATPAQAIAAAAEACGTQLPWLHAAVADPDRAEDALCAGPPVLRGLAAALRLSLASGASLADLCERLAEAAAAEQTAARELTDGLAGARSTATLLTALPLAGICFAALLGARPLGLLLGGSLLGSSCLIVGVGLVRAGQAWTWRLVRQAALRATG